MEVRRRIQVAAGAYGKVTGALGDRRISEDIRKKVLVVCVLPTLTYGLENGADERTTEEDPSVRE